MNRHHVSEHDLHEDLRLAGNIDDLKEVKIAYLERSGEISVQRQPQIFKIEVKDGVQTIHPAHRMKSEIFKIPAFDSKTGNLNAIIETPCGSRYKFACEKKNRLVPAEKNPSRRYVFSRSISGLFPPRSRLTATRLTS